MATQNVRISEEPLWLDEKSILFQFYLKSQKMYVVSGKTIALS
jgi:hypothetical protein